MTEHALELRLPVGVPLPDAMSRAVVADDVRSQPASMARLAAIPAACSRDQPIITSAAAADFAFPDVTAFGTRPVVTAAAGISAALALEDTALASPFAASTSAFDASRCHLGAGHLRAGDGRAWPSGERRDTAPPALHGISNSSSHEGAHVR
ncbi:hypothetical protein [Caballeronia grimmiae]|uniref:hypothetical protein n=1 Tax=Caballeronia grimmiae TaxID=1071679 RepID=UPI001267CF60|nr:hypothetical protein [Caballeronia grimmiae]